MSGFQENVSMNFMIVTSLRSSLLCDVYARCGAADWLTGEREKASGERRRGERASGSR
jgi:hypothetical protein